MTGPQRNVIPPARIAPLPRNHAGYPIPYFVAETPGGDPANPDFRIAGTTAFRQCVLDGRCWVCGQQRYGAVPWKGQSLMRHSSSAGDAFVIGPMCTINRVSADPPSHPECAEYSVKVCPFLSRPDMRRRDSGIVAPGSSMPGIPILRNPGVSAIWVCPEWVVTKLDQGNGGWIFDLGEPSSVTWWREGRPATRDEVIESMNTGLPALLEQCETADDQIELGRAVGATWQFLPPT